MSSWIGSAAAASSPRYHTVVSGQRLGSIAKRYGVSIEALCTANGIERRNPLKIGQKLIVPNRNDKDGSIARRQFGPPEKKTPRAETGARAPLTGPSEPPRPVTHRVVSGQRLESIARRYQVSVDALCEANRIRKHDILRPGQVLVIPGSLPKGGLSAVERSQTLPPPSSKAVKKGYVDLATYTSRYRGVVFDKKGKVTPTAVASVSKLFGATGNRPRVDARLIAILADVSEHFGGRPMRIVSGWRDHSYVDDSRHKHSQAVDFSIPGVPNTVVRDYVRRFRNCGVGYYPNSSFVHLDVRQSAAYWVDYAGPGEAPRTTPRQHPKPALARNDASERDSARVEETGDAVEPPTTTAALGATTAALGAAAATHGASPATTRAATRTADITSSASRSKPAEAAAPTTPAPAAPAPAASPEL